MENKSILIPKSREWDYVCKRAHICVIMVLHVGPHHYCTNNFVFTLLFSMITDERGSFM